MGNVTSLTYDNYGNPTMLTDPLGHQTTFGYSGMGLITSVADGLQNTTQFSYNLADLVGVTDPLQNTTSIFRDAAGRVISRTDPLGNMAQYQYNPSNQLTQVTDALQGVTTFTYDPNGNLQTVQDARQQGTNNKTVYAYDGFDHLQSRTDPLNRQETYVFDQLGNLASFTDRRGKVATYQYDGINRRIFAGYGTLPGPIYESTINYTYDGGNRLKSVVDSASGTITPVFDGLNRLQSETTTQGSVSYGYDNDSRLTSATVSGQPSVCYSYDTASRLTGIGQGTCPTSTNVVSLTYDNANRRKTLTLPNGVVLTYGFDNDSRISAMSYKLGTTVVGALTYQYDAGGRRTQVGGSLAATGFPQTVSSATYDVANELTNWSGTVIGYDANGNIQNDGVAAYSWNARNQLISRSSTSFQYDSFGRRTLNAAGSNLLYEGWNVVQELSGTTPTANRILGSIDEFFDRADTGGTYVPITNSLGSVLALTNSSGVVTSQYGYDPFGNTTSNGGSSTNVFQYTGREDDLNLYYYRARYYDPQIARFVSEDPIGFAGGLNLYQYANGNPVRYRDPSGRDTAQVGVSGQVTVWVVSGTASGGVAWDDRGNSGLYLVLGGGGGTGAGGSVGVQGAWSGGQDINDLGGWFNNVSVAGGAGAGGSADYWGGSTADGRQIFGGGGTVGLGGGAGSFAGRTYTWIIPVPVTAGRFCLPSNEGVPGQMPTGAGTYFIPEPGTPGPGGMAP